MQRPFLAFASIATFAFLGGLGGCNPASNPATNTTSGGTASPAATTTAPTTSTGATSTGAKGKKLYWVQYLKGHPVHRLTQIAFEDSCKKAGYECEVIGTDTVDYPGTIALAEQALSRGDAAGVAIWTGTPTFNSFIAELGKKGIPVVLPHFPVKPDEAKGATGVIACDPAAYARAAAQAIGTAIHGKGEVAITQGSSNTTENLVTKTFTDEMKGKFPGVTVLPAQFEGLGKVAEATSTAVNILQGHPNVVAALSTTGGGPLTWASAQKQAGRKIVVIGMDYTKVNLDLVKSGQIYAVVGQPLWEEASGAVGLLDKAIHKQKVTWWTKLPAPIITKDKLPPYYELQKKVDASLKG